MVWHPERSTRIAEAKKKGRHTKAEWDDLKRRFGFRCLACSWKEGTRDISGKKICLEKDHVQPISQGGCDCIGNIQPLCNVCNASKGSGDYTDYRHERMIQWRFLDFIPDVAGMIDFVQEGFGLEI